MNQIGGTGSHAAAITTLMTFPGVQVFCGMLARIAQFSDILQDSRAQLDKVPATVAESL